ncbi:hypothetical protein BDZ89DRAFT_1044794 [Hymenopellis radicata]|nr:hypothetical protein BDZ89DRAFT_1044794 [Hymenopellis radicata]
MAIAIRRRMAIANPLSAGFRKRESGDGGSSKRMRRDSAKPCFGKIPRPRVPLLKQNAQVPSAPHGAQIPPSSSRSLTSMPTAFHQTLLDDPLVITQRKNPTAPWLQHVLFSMSLQVQLQRPQKTADRTGLQPFRTGCETDRLAIATGWRLQPVAVDGPEPF